jgi:DUF438 domain-containing protein
MAKTYHSANRWALTGLFKRINLGNDPKQLCSEAHHLADKVDTSDIDAAKQTLIDEGYSDQLVQKISEVFMLMGLYEKESQESKLQLSENHILHRIKAENEMTRCVLMDLLAIEKEINLLDAMTDASSEFRRLSHLIESLIIVKEHVEREEDVIFPYLRKYEWDGVCGGVEKQLKKIKIDINNLVALVTSFNSIQFSEFKNWLHTIVSRFSKNVQDQISFEEDLLWPISLIVIEDMKMWDRIKALSDEIGYCHIAWN